MPARTCRPSAAALHAAFLRLLPRLETHGRVYFRHVRSPERREDAVCEMVALAWKWFVRLVERGKDPATFPAAFARYAARAVWSGRRLCGQEPRADVLSPTAQQAHGFAVGSLPSNSTLAGSPLEEALHDNTRTPIPDQISFRLDFPAWRTTRSHRDRAVIDRMVVGDRTLGLAQRFQVSPARISQLRRELHQDWTRFTADPADA